jgi:site-specific DNA-methyltransferase (adenine-specific)
MPEWTMHHGDCLDVLPTLAAGSADCVCMDPPYFLPATHYQTRSGTSRSLSDLSIVEHFFRSVFAEVRRVLKPNGFCYAFCDGQSYPAFYCTAYPHFRRVRPLVWDKVVSFTGYAWRHQHELILFGESADSPPVKTGDGDVIRCRAVPVGEREHLEEKPVELLGRLIAKVTQPGDVVLDPFAGSGATGVAALRLGRAFVGIEKDHDYHALARQSLAEVDGPLFARVAD